MKLFPDITSLLRKHMFSLHTDPSFFFYQGFLHRHWRFTGQQGKGGYHLLFHSTTSARSRTLRHLFATLHVRWLSRIFSHNACVYQTAIRWDLPTYRITIWVIDWLIVCLFTWWIDTKFLLQRFDIGNQPSKHFNVGSTLFLGWYDVATSHNVKSTLKQRCVRQRWNLQRWTTLKQRCVFQRWIEQH